MRNPMNISDTDASRAFLRDYFRGYKLSWNEITEELYIGNWDAALQANELIDGDVAVVNGAEELFGLGAEFDIIVPHGAVSRNRMDLNAKRINEIRESGRIIFSNCAMGIERSVMNALWWLYRYRDFDSPEDALAFIQTKRRQAGDRLDWLDRSEPKRFKELNDDEWEEQTGFRFGGASTIKADS
jgi:hypothetical protein